MADTVTVTTDAQDTAQESVQTVDTSALQAELERLKAENAKLKNAQSNASSDAAKYKRELQARMSEQERAATETKELIEQLKADNEALKKAQTLAQHEAGCVGLGFDANSAKAAASAFYDHDFQAFSAALKNYLVAHDKALLAESVRQTPRPGVGAVEQTVTRDQFNQMGYQERMKLYEEQPDLYKELTRRNE